MGFRGEVLFWFLLLLCCGNISSASQVLNSTTTETPRQVQQEPEDVTRVDLLSNETEDMEEKEDPMPPPAPKTFTLKVYQLRENKPRVRPVQVGQVEEGGLASDWVETGDSVQAQETWTPLIQGPDLNPPLEEESKVLVRFEQRVPVQADSVTAHCGEREVTVEAKRDFLGNGQLIRPSDVTLGGCPALDATDDNILRFQAELQACNSTVTMTEDALIYSFTLTYSPTPIGNTFILKSNQAQVIIQCHYQRRHYVSSGALRPTWTPFASTALAEGPLRFSLRLMTDDWKSPRPSSVFFLGNVMHMEAAVLQGHHVDMRIYVDNCVATAYPEPDSRPRYPFITNHGCLTDAKLTGAKSYFMQRSREDKLHFQLEAFRFHQDHRNLLYITCHLKATTVSTPIDSQHKACSFLTEAQRWVASGGDNKVCDCCESSCGESRGKRSLIGDTDVTWQGTAALGPILLEEDSVLQLTELTEAPVYRPLRQEHKVTEAAPSSSLALLCGVGAAMAVLLLLLMGTVIHSRLRKSAGHDVPH